MFAQFTNLNNTAIDAHVQSLWFVFGSLENLDISNGNIYLHLLTCCWAILWGLDKLPRNGCRNPELSVFPKSYKQGVWLLAYGCIFGLHLFLLMNVNGIQEYLHGVHFPWMDRIPTDCSWVWLAVDTCVWPNIRGASSKIWRWSLVVHSERHWRCRVQ